MTFWVLAFGKLNLKSDTPLSTAVWPVLIRSCCRASDERPGDSTTV